jgi:hypothetical protein
MKEKPPLQLSRTGAINKERQDTGCKGLEAKGEPDN